MMNKKVKLGIFFVFTLAIFIMSIIIFGKFRLTGDGYRLYIDYIFIGDLRVNGKVAYRGGGIVIGFIEKIDINPDGTIRVTAFITDKRVILPEGTLFTIQTVGFGLGEKYIMTTPPTISTEGMKSMPPNTVIKGVEPVSLESALGSIGDIGKDIDMKEIGAIITNLSQTISVISQLLEDNKVAISDAISNGGATIENINKITDSLSVVMGDIDSGKGTAGGLIKDQKLYEEVKLIVQNLKDFSQKVKDNPSTLLFRESTNR